MRARWPSWMSIETLTRLSGSSAACASTTTEYLPREKYCSVREALTSPSPQWSRPFPPRGAERRLPVLGCEFLVALPPEALDRRALQHCNDQHAAVATQLDIPE